jgi:AraC-like DNA-binding protein
LIWCATPRLAGLIQWGTLSTASMHDMLGLGTRLVCDVLDTPSLLVDFRGVDCVHTVDVSGFVERARVATVARGRVARLVVVLPAGLSGIVIGGAVALIAAPCRPMFASEIGPALASVGHEHLAAYDAVDQIAIDARGPRLIAARVRNELERNLVDVTVEACAAALHTSERTMQRRLREAGTSFGEQLRRARVGAAWELLRFSDLKIDAIAARVGLGTASRMSAVFRAEMGVTPTQFRAMTTQAVSELPSQCG